MSKPPRNCKGNGFEKQGRIGATSAKSEKAIVLFGGAGPEGFFNDFLVLPLEHLRDDQFFSEIN